MIEDEIAISTENLSKAYKLYNSPLDRLKEALHPLRKKYHHDFRALHDITFHIKKGETFGIIGKNGSGKSTLLKILTGVLTPTSGSVMVKGKVSALLELGAGFSPEMTGIENVYFNGTLMGYSSQELSERLDEILAFADIGEYVTQPVKTYSSGMFVRLAFSIAINFEPDVLIVDEALAVGDVFFQQKCYKRLQELKQHGVTILFVTHGMADVVQFCQRALLLNNNTIEFIGGAAEAAKRYLLIQQQERLVQYKKAAAHIDVADDEFSPEEHEYLWPASEQFLDVSAVDSVGDCSYKCTRLALCNNNGSASRFFYSGDTLIIYCEFEINSTLEVPIGGFLIKNDQNIMVHGKNTLHYDTIQLPKQVPASSLIRFKFEVCLDIAPGEYTIDVGLATISNRDYEQRMYEDPQFIQSKSLRLCNLSNATSFSVVHGPKRGASFSTLHAGICNLKGTGFISMVKKGTLTHSETEMPTIFHVTHWKAGSQWVKKILRDISPERYIDSKVNVAHFLNDNIIPGKIYPTVYVTREQFEKVSLPKQWYRFIVIRDLRDTLISGYFSLKISHSVISSGILSYRKVLEEMNLENGLLFLIENWLHLSAAIQHSWLGLGEPLIRYEDLLTNDVEIFSDILLHKCGLDVSHDLLEKVVLGSRFEQITGGRASGCEDIDAHARKGVAGDWSNYFTERIKIRFKERYGDLLIATGYEKNHSW